VNIWYHVGSKDEAPGKNGFAHLFEHMMFQGSKHVPEDAYFRYLERAGATDINGTTNTDRTNYFETVPSNQLELALWLESDRMGFLLAHVDQLTFSGQRDVVKNERRQNYENAPYGMVSQMIAAALYPIGHPYHFLTIGSPEDLDHATLEDVRDFFRTWYVPNNATIVVAGDIDKTRARELISKYFGPIPPGVSPHRDPPPKVLRASDTILDIEAGVELPRVYISWPTAPFYAPGDAELDLLARVLTSGTSSRLYKKLVYEMQIAQDVAAYQESREYGSTFEIIATARKGHTPDEILAVIDDELAKVRANGIDENELARAKTITISQMTFDLERDATRANTINGYNQYTGSPDFLGKDFDRYGNATPKMVQAASTRELPARGRVISRVLPKAGAPLCGVLTKTVNVAGAK
jgi:zinc protease